jgi:hypothetical protein
MSIDRRKDRERGEKAARAAAWAGVAVAVAGLIAALVFNGFQVRDSAKAQRQSKIATELALLAQIQSTLTESAYRRVPFAKQFRALREGSRANLSNAAYRAVAEEGANMNYFAWIFNHGYIAADGADDLFGPQMICEFKQAVVPAFEEPARELPDLVEFIQERGHRLAKQAEACELH